MGQLKMINTSLILKGVVIIECNEQAFGEANKNRKKSFLWTDRFRFGTRKVRTAVCYKDTRLS